MEDRRSFFRSLISGGATVSNTFAGMPLKHRKREKSPSLRLYHGPMEIPAHIAEIVRESPDLHKCRGGGQKLAGRYATVDTTWLFRCRVPDHRQMVGEIVRTPEGKVRVHCWSSAKPSGSIPTVERLLVKHRTEPIIPPAVASTLNVPCSHCDGYHDYVEPCPDLPAAPEYVTFESIQS